MELSDTFKLAEVIAASSDDPDTQTACILELAGHDGCISASNQLPLGVRHEPARLVRPEKYSWIEHAERGAIYAAARQGRSTEGATAYMLFAPCMDCARACIEAGIKTVIVSRARHAARVSDRWAKDFVNIHTMFAEASVEFFWWEPDGSLSAHVEAPPLDIQQPEGWFCAH